MGKRYVIWNGQDPVYTAARVYTPEQWKEKHPILAHPSAIPVVSTGILNGGFCGELSDLKEKYAAFGAVFTDGMTAEEVIEVIEAFEDSLNATSLEPSAEERIAAAMEYQNIMNY